MVGRTTLVLNENDMALDILRQNVEIEIPYRKLGSLQLQFTKSQGFGQQSKILLGCKPGRKVSGFQWPHLPYWYLLQPT